MEREDTAPSRCASRRTTTLQPRAIIITIMLILRSTITMLRCASRGFDSRVRGARAWARHRERNRQHKTAREPGLCWTLVDYTRQRENQSQIVHYALHTTLSVITSQ
jgi:hypothetical protein